MRRRLIGVVIAVGACFAALSGCRAALGIDDLDVVAADGGTDSSSQVVDARSDAPNDSSTAADTSTVVCKSQADCPRCCHEGVTTKAGFPKLVELAKKTGCICGTGACSQPTECGNSLCVSTSAPFDPTCGGCVDNAIRPAGTGPCDDAKKQCGPDRTCKDYLDCIISCN